MKPNPIVWCEIYVQDMERAKRFYEAVFQMPLEQMETPEPNIEMWAFPMTFGGEGSAGALVKMEGCPSGGGGIIPYFHCDDVAVEESRVVAAGGTIHKSKMSIGKYGFMALVIDTEGNMIGLYMNPEASE